MNDSCRPNLRMGVMICSVAVLTACGGGGGGSASTGSPGTAGVTIDDTPRFAYTINSSVIGAYVVDPENGNLIPRGHSQNFFETAPVDMVASTNGRHLYFSDTSSPVGPAISRYDINPYTGTHAFAAGAEFGTPSTAQQLVMHPSGRHLFYRRAGSAPITTVGIDPLTGNLSAASQTAPYSISTLNLSPDGNFLYSAFSGGSLDQDIRTFSVATDGTLTEIDADPALVGTQSRTFANASRPGFHPSNGDVYLVEVTAHGAPGSIDRYRRSATTGLLTLIDNTPIPDATTTTTGTWTDGMLVEPQGRYGYVRLNNNLIAGFTIDPNGGTLTPIDYDDTSAGVQHFDFGSRATSTRVVRFEPSGHFVYFGFAGGTLEKLIIDQNNGKLSRPTVKPELNQILALNGLVNAIVFTDRTGVPAPQPTFAYSDQGTIIGIHRIDPATGMLSDAGTLAVPGFGFMAADPAQAHLYLGETSSAYSRVRIDNETGGLSDREVRTNTFPNSRQGPRFDPHNRFAVQTNEITQGLDLMEVVTGPPGGLGNPKTGVQFTRDPYTVSNPGGASAVRPNSRQIYSTGLVTSTPTITWFVRLFNLVATPVSFDRVDANGGVAGHQDFALSTRAVDTVVEPLGRYLLTLEPNPLIGGATTTDNLAVYELDWVTGVPTIRLALTNPFVQPNHTTGSDPLHIALDPRGRFVYVPTDDGIAGFEFTRTTSGPALQAIDIDTATPGFNLLQPLAGRQRLVIDPTGQWLYSGTEGFRIDQTTGALESIGVVSAAPITEVIGRL